MKRMTSLLAVLLCAVLVIGPAAALAAPANATEALEAGREVTVSGALTWHSFPMIDAETNSLIKSAVEAFTFEATMAKQDDFNTYTSQRMLISGEEAMHTNVITTDEGMYIESNALMGYQAIGYDELNTYFTRMGSYMDTMMASGDADMPESLFEGAFGQMGTAMEQVFAQMKAGDAPAAEPNAEEAEKAVNEMLATMGLEDTYAAVMDWVNAEMQGEPYSGQVGSVFGPELTDAMIYALTKERLHSLSDAFLGSLAQSEGYWNFIMENMSAVMEDDTDMTAEELMAQVDEMRADIDELIDAIPDDAIMRYNQATDSNGNYALSQIEVIIPGDENGYGEVVGYVEWQPQGLPVYAELMIEEEGFAMEITPKEAVGDVEDKGFTAIMSIISYDEVVQTLVMQTTSIATETEGGRAWDGSLLLGMGSDYGDDMGIEVLVSQLDTYEGDDLHSVVEVNLSVLMGTSTLPLLTLNASVTTAEPQGAPFDIAAVELVHPAQMSDEEFAAYMQDTMAVTMQTAFGMMSMLPQDVFSAIFQMEGLIEGAL